MVRLLVESRDQSNYQDALLVRALLCKVVMTSGRMIEAIGALKESARKVKYVLDDALKNESMVGERYEEIWLAISQLHQATRELSARSNDMTNAVMDHWRNLTELTHHNPLLADMDSQIVKVGLAMVMSVTGFALSIAGLSLSAGLVVIKMKERPDLYTTAALRQIDYGPKAYAEAKELAENFDTFLPTLEIELTAMDQYLI